MASTSTTIPGDGDDPAKKNSVVIVDMPEDLINRDILKRHFEQYGTVERLACSVSKKYAVIHFSSAVSFILITLTLSDHNTINTNQYFVGYILTFSICSVFIVTGRS